MSGLSDEKRLQEQFPWERSKHFASYNTILGYYQALSCLEHSRGRSLLDLPCGDGTITAMLAARFDRVVGVDASAAHLAEARKRLPQGDFIEAMIEELALDERFGTVSMLCILEHVIDPILTLRCAANFLDSDGVLIAQVPNANAINRRIALRMGTLLSLDELSPYDLSVIGHRRYYTIEKLVADITQAGLRVVTTGGIFYKMLSVAQIDWFLEHGLWSTGGFGWGREGGPQKDWKTEFCRACYDIGKERPEDCNVIYVCATK
jgi:2-polyprenyl-3-methyl-5-hydroxy-6-metoxy-1,4-benzoquinol methylase